MARTLVSFGNKICLGMEAFNRIIKVMKSGFDDESRLTIVGSRSCNDSDSKMAAKVWKLGSSTLDRW